MFKLYQKSKKIVFWMKSLVRMIHKQIIYEYFFIFFIKKIKKYIFFFFFKNLKKNTKKCKFKIKIHSNTNKIKFTKIEEMQLK